MLRRGLTRPAAACAASVALLAFAGCGSSGSSGTTASGAADSTGTSSETSAVPAAVTDAVEAGKKIPAFTFDGSPIDAASVVQGKTVVNVPWGTAVDYPVQVADQMTKAAKTAGLAWDTVKVAGPDQWNRGVEAAVAQKPTLIDLLIMDPTAVRPQVKNALAAGIDVTSTHFWDSSQSALADKEGLTGWTGIDYVKPARTIADWTIADSDGKANVLIIGGPDFTFNEPVLAAMKGEYTKYCPDCHFEISNIPATEWQSKIPSTVVATLQKNPDLDYIIPFSDPASANVIDGLRQANAVGKVKIATYGATPFVLDLVRKGDVAFNCGYSVAWTGYAFVDQILRVLDGQKQAPDIANGMRCFDSSNVAEAGDPATPGQGFGDAYLTGYEKLWGVGG